jgi:hypothetical protein
LASELWSISIAAIFGNPWQLYQRLPRPSGIVSCLGLMTNAQVSPNRKMFYRFKGEKIKTSFIQLYESSNVEKTQYLVQQPGRALS